MSLTSLSQIDFLSPKDRSHAEYHGHIRPVQFFTFTVFHTTDRNLSRPTVTENFTSRAQQCSNAARKLPFVRYLTLRLRKVIERQSQHGSEARCGSFVGAQLEAPPECLDLRRKQSSYGAPCFC
jgi:hypothetical protein